MKTNELTQTELQIIAFGLQDHIDMLDNSIAAYMSEGISIRPFSIARIDTAILLDKIEKAIDESK